MRAHSKNGELQRLGKSRMASTVVITGKLTTRPGRRGPAESQTQSQRVGGRRLASNELRCRGNYFKVGEGICRGREPLVFQSAQSS